MVNSVHVVESDELIKSTEGSKVTLLWKIAGYNINDQVVIEDLDHRKVITFIHGQVDDILGNFTSAGNSKQSFGIIIAETKLEYAGTYTLSIKDELVPEKILSNSTTLFIYSRYPFVEIISLPNVQITVVSSTQLNKIYSKTRLTWSHNVYLHTYITTYIFRYPRKSQYFCQSNPSDVCCLFYVTTRGLQTGDAVRLGHEQLS